MVTVSATPFHLPPTVKEQTAEPIYIRGYRHPDTDKLHKNTMSKQPKQQKKQNIRQADSEHNLRKHSSICFKKNK